MVEGLDRVLPGDVHDTAGLVVVSDDGLRADSSFAVHHLVTSHLRKGHAVVLVALAQSYFHYLSVGRKLGIDYEEAKRNGRLRLIDYLSPGALASALQGHGGDDRLRGIYNDIKTAVSAIGTKNVCVVFDDLTPLTYEGVTPFALQSLVRYTRSLSPMVVVRIHHEEGDDADGGWGVHCRTLYYDASVLLQCAVLPEGNSYNVHGKLTVSHPAPNTTGTVTRCYHYAVRDRSVDVVLVT